VSCFTRTYGLPPHRYLAGRRVEAARRRLLDGEPPADVAVAVGFHDQAQAHLHRDFTRLVGTTPGRYARSLPARSGKNATVHRVPRMTLSTAPLEPLIVRRGCFSGRPPVFGGQVAAAQPTPTADRSDPTGPRHGGSCLGPRVLASVHRGRPSAMIT
jgi:AraC-like DNA-binding protein